MDILKLVPLGESRELADETLAIFNQNSPLPFSALTTDDIEHFLAQLDALPELDGYWVESFLADASAAYPDLILAFFLARLEYSQSINDWRYRVCNLHAHQTTKLRLRTAPNADACIAKLLDWIVAKNQDVSMLMEAGALFTALCSGQVISDRQIGCFTVSFAS